MPIDLSTVISELTFIAKLAHDNPQDPRLKTLLNGAATDLFIAARSITGDSPLIDKPL